MQIPQRDGHFPGRSRQSICKRAPPFAKCFDNIEIVIISKQRSINNIIYFEMAQSISTSAEHVLSPLPISFGVAKFSGKTKIAIPLCIAFNDGDPKCISGRRRLMVGNEEAYGG
ncbi:UNVERIFIED_CONTAM: hypothetical protein Sangu_3013500 [Sesamum angustifolium]|uniref:Uncharacterized protein n=1 Tax=Sesamum angustifolium TaxID=2727405 RepID=A0AAW2KMU9_9LAMI